MAVEGRQSKGYRSRISRGAFLIALAVLSHPSHAERWEPEAIDRLAMRLESKYRRDIYRNPYSLHFIARRPNTIVLEVRVGPKADSSVVSNVVREAEHLVKNVARDEFKLEVQVAVDRKNLSP